MRARELGLFLALLPPVAAFQTAPAAATLALSSGSALPGAGASLTLDLGLSNGAQVSGVQWTLTYPLSSIAGIRVETGSAASAAGKSLECAAGPNPGVLNCIVFGLNRTAIAAGPIAVLTFNIAAAAPAGGLLAGISGVAFSDPNGLPVQVLPPPTGGTISVLQSGVSQLRSLSCNPDSVTGPATVICTAALSGPAPPGGVVVALSSDKASVTIPTSVTVPAGTANVSFAVSAAAVASEQIAFLTASASELFSAFPLTVLAPLSGPRLEVFPPQVDFFVQPGRLTPVQSLHVSTNSASRLNVNVSPASSGWLSTTLGVVTVPTQVAAGVSNAPSNLPLSGTVSLAPLSQSVPTVEVPVNLRAAGPSLYYIPRFVDGGGFATTVTISNLDAVPASVSLRFRRALPDSTTVPWTPLMEGGQTVENTVIPVGGSFTWRTAGLGSLPDSGWAQVLCDRKIGGFAIYRQRVGGRADQEAAVPVVSTWQQRIILPFDNTGSLVTSIAITNASETETGLVRGVFRDENGQVLEGAYRALLPPLGHRAFSTPEELASLRNRRGTAEFIMLGGRMSAAGLRFSASAFTSFEAQTLNSASSGRLILPQVANGGGFFTTITLVNKDAVPATVALQFHRRAGSDGATEPWYPPMVDSQPAQGVTIPPGSSATWQTTGAGAAEQGWAEVSTAQHVSGFAVFLQRVAGRADQEAAVPVNAGPQQRFLLPFDNSQSFTTTLALANFSGDSLARITAIVRDEQNATIDPPVQFEIPVRGHQSFSLPERFPQTAGRRGNIEFQVAAGNVSALGLRFAGESFTSFRPQVIQ